MTDILDQTLVVGGSGRVGRLLARAWAQAGHSPTLQYRGTPLDWSGRQIAWQPLTEPLPPARYAAMIVLAGAVRGDLSLNVQLAEACLRAAGQAGIGKILLASSSAVYGASNGQPCREETPLAPVNDYGRAKIAAEAVAEHWRARGLAVTCLRIGNVAGADALLTNPARPLLLDHFGNGATPLRSYIGAQTMARVLAALLVQDLPPVLNLAAPDPVAMGDLAAASGLPWQYQPAPATAYPRITLDCSALAARVAFTAADSTAAEMIAQWHASKGPQ